MFICKICCLELTRGSGHIKAKHGISTLEYLKQYESLDVAQLYSDGYSAEQITKIIKEKNLGLNPIKKDILLYLRENSISIRNTSEATKCWLDKTGGVWNKGLTKQEHPSVLKYAQSRMGKNNPYYLSSDESRDKIKWWNHKTTEQIKEIRSKISNNLREQYKNGTIIPYYFLNSEWAKDNQLRRMEGYLKYLKSDNKHKFGNPSLAEREIASFLEERDIKYIKQANVVSRYSCDFLLPDYSIIIEYYGTYWHCDPRKYKFDYFNQKKNKTAHEIWEYDSERENLFKKNGYKLLIIWEEDFKRLDSQQKRTMIYESIESQISN
jgi:G:T-mismatch repair DNA endonuclease (very short patch repair protein)